MSNATNKNTINEKLGENIRSIRKSLNLTQEQLAEKLNINCQFLSQAENGKSGISIDTAINLCNIAHCSSTHLFKDIIKSSNIIDQYEILSDRDKTIINQMIIYLSTIK